MKVRYKKTHFFKLTCNIFIILFQIVFLKSVCPETIFHPVKAVAVLTDLPATKLKVL
jgi:hypothetical protein